jgi:hypothetical protein
MCVYSRPELRQCLVSSIELIKIAEFAIEHPQDYRDGCYDAPADHREARLEGLRCCVS